MASSRGASAVLAAAGLVACGVAGGAAWRAGLWGSLAGAALAALWLGAATWWAAARPRPERAKAAAPGAEAAASRVLLDAAPTPLVGVEGGAVRALNRAARALFGTDDRVLPAPPELADPGAARLRHEGRSWRIDRVEAGARTLAALVDVEREERSAEARAAAELIQVLGHELLNGLAPIASLAESGLAALEGGDPALLAEVLGTLARRAEGLQRFAEGYRALARLPDPVPRPAPVGEMVEDLTRLFAGRWPGVALAAGAPGGLVWPLDRDQVAQAAWALLQNAAEAAEAGEAAPRVTLDAWAEGGGLVVEVGDSGAGLAPDAAARAFRPFHTTKPGGTGVGLSLARRIAQGHGGTLALMPGAPTRFRLVVPGAA